MRRDASSGWRPISSEWYLAGDRVIGVATNGGAGICRWDARARGISFRLDEPLSSQQSAGVVVGYRGPDDYVVVSITHDGQLGVHVRHRGEWTDSTVRALPADFDPTRATIAVIVRDDAFIVRVDGAPLLRPALAPAAAANGSLGLFMQRRYDPAAPWSTGQVTFVDVDVR